MTLHRYLVSCHEYDVLTGRNRLVVWRVAAVSAAAAIEGIRGTRSALGDQEEGQLGVGHLDRPFSVVPRWQVEADCAATTYVSALRHVTKWGDSWHDRANRSQLDPRYPRR